MTSPSMFDMFSEDSAFRVLARLTNEELKIFAAASQGNRFIVKAADTHGREICIRTLGEKGFILDPYVFRMKDFVGINFLRILGVFHAAPLPNACIFVAVSSF